MFTVEQRERVHERLVEMARADARVVAAAVVGSRAGGGGDRWSDLDLTFGLADGASLPEVLADWTQAIEREFAAVRLFDLPFLSSVYRVFLLPGSLQVDLSFTPGADFGALGPQFELLFGSAVERAHPPLPPAEMLLGHAVHHLVRARFCIERGRAWQAEYWIGLARDQAMALASLRFGLDPRQARGCDQLPREVADRFGEALVRALERAELMRALAATIACLRGEAAGVPGLGAQVDGPLRELLAAEWAPRG